MNREEVSADLIEQLQQAMGGMYNPGVRMRMLWSEVRHTHCVKPITNYCSCCLFFFCSAQEKANQLYEALKSETEAVQLEAATELCNYFSIGTESSVSSIKLDRFVPELLNLLQKEHNTDLMRKLHKLHKLVSCWHTHAHTHHTQQTVLSARALTHMIDCVPSSASLVVSGGGVALLNEKLLNIAYIDLAEQCLFVLDHLIQHHGPNLIREGSLMAILAFIDFFGIDIQRKIANMAANMCRQIPSNCFANVECVLPNIVNLLSSHDTKGMWFKFGKWD